MEIESIKIGDIKPYENNPRQNDKAVEAVKASIREFGYKVPIVIDKNNVIVCGHTRYKALKQLKWDKIPCIRADDLTDDQIKAFRIADNKVSELAEWDLERLQVEIDEISLDMSSFGIEIGDIDPVETEDDDSGWYGDERERTNRAYNLNIVDHSNLTDDFWQMPIIRKTECIPADLIGFNYAKTSKDKGCGIHFFVDDYQFERVWSYPEKYVDILAEYDCILTPDFSLYMDMPMPMKIWNIYRSRQIGTFYQQKGMTVIPTISWAESATFDFCFKGIEQGGTVAISTIGVKESKDALKIWKAGTTEMIKQIKPSAIVVYGGKIDFDYKGIKTVYYENKVTENWE